MEHLRHCILQVNTICSERDPEDPRKIEEINAVTLPNRDIYDNLFAEVIDSPPQNELLVTHNAV